MSSMPKQAPQRANLLQGTLDRLVLRTLLHGSCAWPPNRLGRKQLVVEESQWKQMAEAVARVIWLAIEES